jgi:hypothetical protein
VQFLWDLRRPKEQFINFLRFLCHANQNRQTQ